MARYPSRLAASVVLLMICVATSGAQNRPPLGVVAASVADQVFVVDPATGRTVPFQTGPVAWLFPAPGGVLFAPDLVNSRTTVIDLRRLRVSDSIRGVTMPRFGTLADRYLVLSRQLLVMSYPDRALMNRFEIPFENPWQVEVLAGNTVLLVLERLPETGGEVRLTAVNLGEGRLVYRRPLAGDVRHFAASPVLGLMALAAAEARQVILADPATLTPVAVFATDGKPIDLVFADDGSTLAVAVELSNGGGELLIWKLKKEKKKGLQKKKEWVVPLAGPPRRLAGSPDGRHVAAGLASGAMQVVELTSRALVSTAEFSDAPRDVVWCDPSIEGPLLPNWSDNDQPDLSLGGG